MAYLTSVPRSAKATRLCASHSVTYDPTKATTSPYINRDGVTHLHKYKDGEVAYVEEVRIIGSESGTEPCQSLSIKLRIPRSPIIGDKFSSRHGQKGVCSQKWPAIDMPFSESGIIPDIIINPHAFPSRMTIGMFIESLAGKAGALHGLAQDSTPLALHGARHSRGLLRRAAHAWQDTTTTATNPCTAVSRAENLPPTSTKA